MTKQKQGDKRRAARRMFETSVEFFVEADLLRATSVNISSSGMRFDTDRPLEICLRMPMEGKLLEKRGRLVWSRKLPGGGMTYGVEFVPGPPVTPAEGSDPDRR